jgi:hypothetical protein
MHNNANALTTRTTLLLVAIALLITATVAVGVLNSAHADGGPVNANAKANALASQPAVPAQDPADHEIGQRLSGARLRAVAADMARGVPVPSDGGFADIDWDAIGSSSANGVRSFLEYNASCDWYRNWLKNIAAGNSTEADEAAKTIVTIAAWPSFRNGESGPMAARVADAVANGKTGAVQEQVNLNCG